MGVVKFVKQDPPIRTRESCFVYSCATVAPMIGVWVRLGVWGLLLAAAPLAAGILLAAVLTVVAVLSGR